jgi:hypothetical protein
MPPRTIVAALLLLVLPAGAHADIEALLGKYATSHDGCASGAAPEYEIRRGIVEGPDLLCILGAPKQAPAPGEAYEAKCTQAGKVHLGVLTIDLSDPDRIEIGLPETQDRIALYRCE